ncbi:MAG: hypothetical protein ACYTDT_10630 [Planctomycetota bacterium]|jgi:hypothetical protein
MRFLTREFAEDQLEDFHSSLYHQVYVRHLEEIFEDLPAHVGAFAIQTLGVRLRGLELQSVIEDAGDETLTLMYGAPEEPGLQVKFYYSGVNVDSLDEAGFAKLEEAGASLLADELDLAPDERFEHRLLFAPDGEVAVQFLDLEVETIRPDDSAPDHSEPQ